MGYMDTWMFCLFSSCFIFKSSWEEFFWRENPGDIHNSAVTQTLILLHEEDSSQNIGVTISFLFTGSPIYPPFPDNLSLKYLN